MRSLGPRETPSRLTIFEKSEVPLRCIPRRQTIEGAEHADARISLNPTVRDYFKSSSSGD